MSLSQRIPALEGPPDTPSPEPRESPQTASEEPSGTQDTSGRGAALQGVLEEAVRGLMRRFASNREIRRSRAQTLYELELALRAEGCSDTDRAGTEEGR